MLIYTAEMHKKLLTVNVHLWVHFSLSGMSLGKKKISDTFFGIHNLSQLVVWGGAVSPPEGSGALPRKQTHIGNNILKIVVLLYNLIIIYLYNIGAQNSWFFLSYITKRKIGHSFHRLSNPPSEGPKLVIITHPCPETTGQLPPVCKCLISHPNK